MPSQGDKERTPKVGWWTVGTPPNGVTISNPTWVGLTFQVAAATYCWGARVFCPTSLSWMPIYAVWQVGASPAPQLLGCNHRVATPGGLWVNCWMHPRFKLVPGTRYAVAAMMQTQYFRYSNLLTTPTANGNITAYNGFVTTSQAPWTISPTLTAHANGVDVLTGEFN
jgi:hypothetical protein